MANHISCWELKKGSESGLEETKKWIGFAELNNQSKRTCQVKKEKTS